MAYCWCATILGVDFLSRPRFLGVDFYLGPDWGGGNFLPTVRYLGLTFYLSNILEDGLLHLDFSVYVWAIYLDFWGLISAAKPDFRGLFLDHRAADPLHFNTWVTSGIYTYIYIYVCVCIVIGTKYLIKLMNTLLFQLLQTCQPPKYSVFAFKL